MLGTGKRDDQSIHYYRECCDCSVMCHTVTVAEDKLEEIRLQQCKQPVLFFSSLANPTQQGVYKYLDLSLQPHLLARVISIN